MLIKKCLELELHVSDLLGVDVFYEFTTTTAGLTLLWSMQLILASEFDSLEFKYHRRHNWSHAKYTCFAQYCLY